MILMNCSNLVFKHIGRAGWSSFTFSNGTKCYPQIKLVITVKNMDSNEINKKDYTRDINQLIPEPILGEDYGFDTSLSSGVEIEKSVCSGLNENQVDQDLLMWKNVLDQKLGKAEYPDLKIFRKRHLTDVTAVFRHNAWDDVEWDENRRADAVAAVAKNSITLVDPGKQAELEENAHLHWDKFYGIHQNKFFRDRNWLFSEFPELESPYGCSVDKEESQIGIKINRQNENYPGENSKFKVLEIGCGAGNTVFPLLVANNNPETYVYACDFSPTAVDIVQNHNKFETDRCTAFVFDATQNEPIMPFTPASIDVITIIFVISAINPEKFDQVLKNFYSFLKPGGIVLFRDYGRYDLAQLRFKEGRCLSDNFYMRGDGTRVYFFTEDEVTDIFQRNGFIKDKLLVDQRLQVNRGKQLQMYRVWIQGKFRKP